MTNKLLSFDETGFQFAWDSTSLGNLMTCPRKYQYQNLLGYQSPTKSVHLVFGGHYAKALERFHKFSAAPHNLSVDEATDEVLRLLLLETWEYELDAEGQPIPGTGQAWESMHSTKTRDTLIRSVVWYLDQFANDPMPTVILSDGRPAVEYSFSIELTPRFLYCGHIDRLVEYSDGVYVQDQKTSGATVTQKYYLDYSPDVQMSGYAMAGQIIFGLPVSGVVIDAAQIAVGFTAFSRGFVSRSPQVLEDFRHDVLYWIELAERFHRDQYYPMNTKACGNYGGCEFRDVCRSNPNNRLGVLASNFAQRDRWDPLKKR